MIGVICTNLANELGHDLVALKPSCFGTQKAKILPGLVGACCHLCARVPLFILAELSEAAEDRRRRRRGVVLSFVFFFVVVLSSMAVVLQGGAP